MSAQPGFAPHLIDISDLPPLTEARFGLRSVADFKGPRDGEWAMGITWDATCEWAPDSFINDCAVGSSFSAPSLSNSLTPGEAAAFTVYSQRHCSLLQVRHPSNYIETTHLNAFHAAEMYGVESALAKQVAADPTLSTITTSKVVNPVFTDPKKAIAALLSEWYINWEPYQPIVHITPDVAVMLGFDNLRVAGNHLELVTGEKVVVGPGYLAATGTAPDWQWGQGKVFITGPVFGYYGVSRSVIVDNREANASTVIAHRNWVVGYECAAIYASIDTDFDLPEPSAPTGVSKSAIPHQWQIEPQTNRLPFEIGRDQNAADAFKPILDWLNGDPVIGVGGTNTPPTFAAEDVLHIPVVDHNGRPIPNSNIGFHWDGTKWIADTTLAGNIPAAVIQISGTNDYVVRTKVGAEIVTLANLKADAAIGDGHGPKGIGGTPVTLVSGAGVVIGDGSIAHYSGGVWSVGRMP